MKHAAFAAVLAVFVATPVLSDGSIDHYAPQPSDTLQEAVSNFTEYNSLLAGILDKGDLSADDMEDIHQLTYTLEVALAKLISESTELAVQLENVHQASEGEDVALLRDQARSYLETAQTIMP